MQPLGTFLDRREPTRIYLFRSDRLTYGRDTVVCTAPLDLVVAVYGGGGHQDQDGVQSVFGGSAFYRNETGERFIGVWGARNAARFRAALRRHAELDIVHEPPPARLMWWTQTARPPAARRHRSGQGSPTSRGG